MQSKISKQFMKCSNHNVYCERCGYKVKSSRSRMRKEHQASSRCDPQKVWDKCYKCAYCEKGFTTEKYKHKHKQDQHVVGKSHTCALCWFCCSTSTGLKKHSKLNICKDGKKLNQRQIWY